MSDTIEEIDGKTWRVTRLKSGAVIKAEIVDEGPRPPRYSLEDLKKDIDLIKGALNI